MTATLESDAAPVDGVEPDPPETAAPKQRRARRPVPSWVVAAIAVFLLTAWVAIFVVVVSPVTASRAESERYAQLRQGLAEATTPFGGVIQPGTPIFLISAPTAGMGRLVVVEGTASGQLMGGPGHRADTVMPGQPGVSVVYGRSATFGAAFSSLPDLVVGDSIVVTTGQGSFTYRVEGFRRPGDPLPPALTKDESRMVLVTATGTGPLGLMPPTTPLYVDTSLVAGQQVQQVPPGRPSAVDASAQALGSETGALFPLVLWMQALILALGAAIWASVTWDRWKAWVVAVPVLIFLSLAVTQTAMRLLPNLI